MSNVRYVDIPMYCDDCDNCRRAGDIMVGTDATGGGPEESFTCEKDRNMSYYFRRDDHCPDCDHGEDDWEATPTQNEAPDLVNPSCTTQSLSINEYYKLFKEPGCAESAPFKKDRVGLVKKLAKFLAGKVAAKNPLERDAYSFYCKYY